VHCPCVVIDLSDGRRLTFLQTDTQTDRQTAALRETPTDRHTGSVQWMKISESFCWTVIMVALCNRADHYIFMLFLLSSSYFFFLA